MSRRHAVWPYALAVSLLLHAALLLPLLRGGDRAIETPAPSRVEARLLTPPPAPAPPAAVRAQPANTRPPAAKAAAVQALAADEAPRPFDGAADEPAPTPVDDATEIPPVPPAAADNAAADVPAAAPLNVLPPRIDMRFTVRYGLARGEQTLVWVSEGDTYTVTSVAAATGLAGVFYSGRFVQTSRGRITAQGLVPESFWDQRGDKHSSARFDTAGGLLTYSPAQGAPRQYAYQGVAQDTLSLFFQLALTAPPQQMLHYPVFNGRRLRDYAYEVRGETVLDTALGPLRTLHLARSGQADGRFEVWLAMDRHYLPVRVLRVDDKGSEVELAVASIAP